MANVIQVGVSGLLANQRTMQTIGHNIANADNPNYKKQKVVLEPNIASSVAGYSIGSGVRVASIERQLNHVLQNSAYDFSSASEQYNMLAKFAERIDLALSDVDYGLNNKFVNFFQAWQVLANNPSVDNRMIAYAESENLANAFSDFADFIDNTKKHLEYEIQDSVVQINELTASIASINKKIMNNVNLDHNDLLDVREGMLQDLAKLVHISVEYHNDKTIDLYVGNSINLLAKTERNTIGVSNSNLDPKDITVSLVNKKGANVEINNSIYGGRLGGALSAYYDNVNQVSNEYSALACSLIGALNHQHRQGVDYAGSSDFNLFSDLNSRSLMLNRSYASENNNGNARLLVKLNESNLNLPEPKIWAHSTGLKATGTLPKLDSAGVLLINGISVEATKAGNDLVSSVDAADSAIAIAASINSSYSDHLVNVNVKPNIVNLGGLQSIDALSAGNFQINGVDVISSGLSADILLYDINHISNTTGVVAHLDSNHSIVLCAQDGRNIQLSSDGGSNLGLSGLNFSNTFDLVQRSSLELVTDSDFIELGNDFSALGFEVGKVSSEVVQHLAEEYFLVYKNSKLHLYNEGKLVHTGQLNQSSMQYNGVSIELDGGSLQENDSYLLKPYNNVLSNISLAIDSAGQLAAAQSILIDADNTNQGNMEVQAINLVNGLQDISYNKLRLEVVEDNKYILLNETGDALTPAQDISSELFPIEFFSGDDNFGFRLKVSGKAAVGDKFYININNDLKNDARNALAIADIANMNLIENKTVMESSVGLIGDFATQTKQIHMQANANRALLDSVESQIDAISGVNIDEQAALMMQVQQSYQAAAQVINVGRNLFDTLFSILRG